MDHDLSDVSVVVLSFDRRDALQRNLPILVGMTMQTGCELIVVDNASTDGSQSFIEAELKSIDTARWIFNDTNCGVAAGRNEGWHLATRDFILSIDDDLSINAEAANDMAGLLRSSRHIGLVGPVIIDPEKGELQNFSDAKAANFHGACHMIRRDLAASLGFNDLLCSFGGEELDLSIRIRAAGFELAFLPDSKVIHDRKARSGAEARERRKRWLSSYTRVLFKHFPLTTALPMALRLLAMHMVSGMRAFGPAFSVRLTGPALQGYRGGRRQHSPAPAHVLRFYQDPDLRPEFGNRPLWRKLLEKLRSRRIRQPFRSTQTRSRIEARDR